MSGMGRREFVALLGGATAVWPLAARLEGIRAIKAAFTTLYAALSDDQKKTAGELLAPHMGMMGTMGTMGMMRGQMQPGPMQPGQAPQPRQ